MNSSGFLCVSCVYVRQAERDRVLMGTNLLNRVKKHRIYDLFFQIGTRKHTHPEKKSSIE